MLRIEILYIVKIHLVIFPCKTDFIMQSITISYMTPASTLKKMKKEKYTIT